MTALGVKLTGGSGVTTASGANGYAPDITPHITGVFGDGYKLAFFQALVSGTPTTLYAVWNGSAWAAAPSSQSISGNPLALGCAIVQVSNVVYLISISGSTLSIRSLTWNTGTHALSVGAALTLAMPAGSNYGSAIAAAWDSAHSAFYIATASATGGTILTTSSAAVLLHTASFGSSGGAIGLAQNGQSAAVLHLLTAAGICLPITTGSGGTITTGTGENFRTGTSAPTPASAPGWAYDGSGFLDVVWAGTVLGTHPLVTRKRTGTNTYSSLTTLDTEIGAGTNPYTVQYNSSSGNLRVYYEDTSNQANGELYLAKRTSGTWAPSSLVAGGDDDGYGAPSAASFVDSTVSDFLYTFGSSSFDVYAVRSTLSSAPDTPTVTAPSGTVGASGTVPVPTISYTYSNATPGDTQGAYEVEVIRVSDSHVMWDSGKVSAASTAAPYGVTSNTGDVNYVAPTNLSYGVAYQAKVRQWDAISDSVSAYATPVSFTLEQAPAPAIISVASPTGGTASNGSASGTLASGTSIGATSLTLHSGQSANFTTGESASIGVSPNIEERTITRSGDTLSWTGGLSAAHSTSDPVVQAGTNTATAGGTTYDVVAAVINSSANNVNGVQVTLWDSTGTTIIGQSAMQTLSPTVAPGATVTVTAFSVPAVMDGATYLLEVALRDAVTSLVGTSERWTITESFTPPVPPTITDVDLDPTATTMTLTWTNDASAASVTVYRRLHGASAWTTISSGTLRTTITDFPYLLEACDWGLQTVNAQGIGSSIVEVNNRTLGLPLNTFTVLLNDVSDPANIIAYLGIYQDDQTGTERDNQVDMLTWVPSGRSKPKVRFGPTKYWLYAGRTYLLPATVTDGVTVIDANDTITTLEEMQGKPLLYRDTDAHLTVVTIANVKPQALGGIDRLVQLDISEIEYDGPPITA